MTRTHCAISAISVERSGLEGLIALSALSAHMESSR
jgi:hypothetical protein